MKVLVVGGGGREHAIAWAMAQSRAVREIYIAPGNGGTAALGENVSVSADDVAGLLRVANEIDADLTVVGPEAPLVAGVVDTFTSAGRRCCTAT